jgi:hypothetical protein
MPKLIEAPAIIEAAGTKPKRIEEYTGRVRSGHAGVSVARIVSAPGEWVRYSSPEPGGAEYVAICLPAFSVETVHRDPE